MSGILQTKNYRQFQIVSFRGEIVYSFEGAARASKALPGDWVVWEEAKQECRLVTRTTHHPLVGVLELASKTKYGMTSRGSPLYLFTPYRTEYPLMVVGCADRDTSVNKIAIVEFDSWDGSSALPRGTLRKILGSCGDYQVEKEALLLTYNSFKKIKESDAVIGLEADEEENEDGCNREQRCKCPEMTFNIDPEGCKDVDDVLSFHQTDDSYQIWITIADVAEHVKPNTILDKTAALQAFTGYEEGIAKKPMLPFEYSENLCSLLPGETRLGVSLVLDLEKQAPYRVQKEAWKLTEVHNKKQYSYDNFVELATKDGIPVGIFSQVASNLLGYSTDDPHEWIEAFMLKYNIEAAKILCLEKQGILRKHEAPDADALAFYKSLKSVDLLHISNRSAIYCSASASTATRHYGLNVDAYCHATSPIRRYADLYNQRILKKDFLRGENPDIVWLNQRQKDMKRYERDLFFLTKVAFYKKECVEAIVLSVSDDKSKYKLWIPEWKRLLTWKPNLKIDLDLNPEDKIHLSYFVNPSSRRWKDRIIFRFESKI
jgi:exoribonuclease R